MKKDVQTNFDTLKLIHDSTNKAVERLENENGILRKQNELLISEKTQWDMAKMMQTEIIQKELGNKDVVISELQNQIQEMKNKMRKNLK